MPQRFARPFSLIAFACLLTVTISLPLRLAYAQMGGSSAPSPLTSFIDQIQPIFSPITSLLTTSAPPLGEDNALQYELQLRKQLRTARAAAYTAAVSGQASDPLSNALSSLVHFVANIFAAVWLDQNTYTTAAPNVPSAAAASRATSPYPNAPPVSITTTKTIAPTPHVIAQGTASAPSSIDPTADASLANNFVTKPELNAELSSFGNALAQLIYQLRAPVTTGPSAPLSVESFAPSQRIDNLNNVTISNATVSGVSGLKSTDIPSLNYLPVVGGTSTGPIDNTFTGTSTWSGNLQVDGALSLNAPAYFADVPTPAATTNRLYSNGGSLFWAGNIIAGGTVGNWSSDGTNAWRATGAVGVGTTSPATTFAVAGSSYISGGLGIGLLNTAAGTLQTSGAATIGGNLSVSGVLTNLQHASTTQLTNSGNTYLTSLASALLATDNTGKVTATTSIGTNLLNGIVAVANGGTGASSFSYGLVLSPGGAGSLQNIATSSLGLLTTNVAEGTNLYFTTNRVASVVAGTTTDALKEGSTNLYYTDSRARNALSATYPIQYSSGSGLFTLAFGTTTANTWSQLQTLAGGLLSQSSSTFTAFTNLFGGASTTAFTNSGPTWFTSLANALLSTDQNGKIVATTSVGTNYLTGLLGTINGTNFNVGSSITVTAASSTLLSDNNTFSGNDTFSNTITGSISGNAGTATNLQTARTINGVSFDGTANITINAASSTLLSDNNTFSGNNLFSASNTFTKVVNLQNASSSLFSVSGTAYFGSTGISSFASSGSLTLATPLTVANGGTGWASLATGAIPYGNGSSAIATTTAGTPGYVLAYLNGVPTWTPTTTLSTIAGTLSTSQGGTGSTTLTGILKGNGTGSVLTALPAVDYQTPITANYPILFSSNNLSLGFGTTTANLWGALQSFASGFISQASSTFTALTNLANASTTQFTNSGPTWLTSLANALLSTDQNGKIVATTSVGTNYLTGLLGTINGTNFNVGSSITVTGASSTLLGDYNTFSGSNTFTKALTLSGSSGTTTIASGQGFTVGGSQFVLQQGSGNVGIGTTSPGSILSVQGVANWTSATSTYYSSGGLNLTSGCFSVQGVCISGGTSQWTTNGSNIYFNTGHVGIGTTSPYSILSVAGQVVGQNFVATSTSATSTFAMPIAIQAGYVGFPNTSGTIIGVGAGVNKLSDNFQSDDTLIGYHAGAVVQTGVQTFQTFIGAYAGAAASAGAGSTAVGQKAFITATTLQSSVAVGSKAGSNLTNAQSDTFLGYAAAQFSTSTNNGGRVFVGYNAGQYDNGDFDINVGYNAGPQTYNPTSASYNIAIGNAALQSLNGGTQDIAIGRQAGTALVNGSGNVFIGHQSGQAATGAFWNVFAGTTAGFNTTGSANTFIGDSAGQSNTSGQYNIAIGQSVTPPIANGSQQLDIGNVIYGTGVYGTHSVSAVPVSAGMVAIGTTTPYARLSVWGPDAASSTLAFNVVNNASTTVFAVFDGGNAQLSGTLTQSSDQRLKTNVQTLDASSSLSLIDELKPVSFNWIDPNQGTMPQLGFIAQEVQQVFPNLVSTTSPTALTPNGTLGLNYIDLIAPVVSAIQEIEKISGAFEQSLIAWLGNASNGIGDLFATNIRAQNKLCIGSTCVTEPQLKSLLAQVNSSPTPGQGTAPVATSTVSETPTAPPTISVNGDNPAVIHVGGTYSDLGATITGPAADTNLDIRTFLNGSLVSEIAIDTSAMATDTIDYVVTDASGLTATSTRTVIVSPLLTNAPLATTTEASSVPH